MSSEERDAETPKPLFIDNRDGNTLARAITRHLAVLRDEGRIPAELCVASCCFNPQGLELIAGEAQHVPRIRLLLGADPTPEALLPRRTPYDPTEPEFTRRRVGQGLLQLERGLKHDRDLLPFDLAEDRAIRSLLEFLRPGRIEVRRYEGHFLHAKAFVFRGAERGVLAGSANLTRAGLQTNLELVLGHHEDPLVARVEGGFESLWRDAVPFDLAAIYAELLAEVRPYLVYLKVLWHLYHAEPEDEEKETGKIPITTFQKHGVWRARKILAKYGGVMVADGVGLGKTATGEQSFAETRLHREDASIYEVGGTEGAAQTGEEYRQELRRALGRYGDAIRDLPWRTGSGMRKGERSGHLFCATVGERVYLRFVPREPEGEINGELGTCLRLLECSEDTPRVLCEEMVMAAYPSWDRARRNIFDAWTFETDPANLQPKIRKLNRDVAEFLRANPPVDVDQERLHRCLDAVESPWPRREENLLRLAWERPFETSAERSRVLVEEVERIGAEPFHAPDPLPPIEMEEIHLITWIAIERETVENAGQTCQNRCSASGGGMR